MDTITSTDFLGVERREELTILPHNNITMRSEHTKTVTNDMREQMVQMRREVHEAIKDGCDGRGGGCEELVDELSSQFEECFESLEEIDGFFLPEPGCPAPCMQLITIVNASNCSAVEDLGVSQDVYDGLEEACATVQRCSNQTERLVNKLGDCSSALDDFALGDQCPAPCKAVRDILVEDDACLDALDAELPEDVRDAIAAVCAPECGLLENELAECVASLTNLNMGDKVSGIDTLDLHRCPASCMHVVHAVNSTSCILFDGVDEDIYNGLIEGCNITEVCGAEVETLGEKIGECFEAMPREPGLCPLECEDALAFARDATCAKTLIDDNVEDAVEALEWNMARKSFATMASTAANMCSGACLERSADCSCTCASASACARLLARESSSSAASFC